MFLGYSRAISSLQGLPQAGKAYGGLRGSLSTGTKWVSWPLGETCHTGADGTANTEGPRYSRKPSTRSLCRGIHCRSTRSKLRPPAHRTQTETWHCRLWHPPCSEGVCQGKRPTVCTAVLPWKPQGQAAVVGQGKAVSKQRARTRAWWDQSWFPGLQKF